MLDVGEQQRIPLFCLDAPDAASMVILVKSPKK
jgi:hypothetical protein